jgi:GR25 family glycosyltransferase involved in LPS biosynthesis
MENSFIQQINLCTKNGNQFLNIQKYLQANSYYITTYKSEKQYYNSLLLSNGIKAKKVYARSAKGSSSLSKEECSYIETWNSILKNDQNNYVLMLDDDVRFSYDFLIEIKIFLAAVPTKWDILYLGASQHNWEGINPEYHYYKAKNTKGSFAVLLSPSGVSKTLEALNMWAYTKPLDEVLHLLQGHKYVAHPNLVISDVAYSTMRNPRNVKIHAERMHWNLLYYDYFKYLRLKVFFVVNSPLCKQSYKEITYYQVNDHNSLKNNKNYEEQKKNHDITIIHIKNTKPCYFFVEKEIKFVLKTEP